jgi:Protein of unknown function (DUF5132)
MAWNDALTEFAPNALVGAGLVIAVPIVYPMVRGVLRPAAKGAIKGYLALQDTVTEWAAEGGEQFSDLVAEAKAEYRAAPTITGGRTEAGDDAGTRGTTSTKRTRSSSGTSSANKSS